MSTTSTQDISYRARAMLRAIAAGRGQITLSCEPDLFIDGIACCDQITAHQLAHQGLVRPARPGLVGQRIPAVITSLGADLVAARPNAA